MSILSICIPIYNRSFFLEKMLESFLQDRDLFEDKIHLFISDNHSEENLVEIISHYQESGLNVDYRINSQNIGPDANIVSCFKYSKSKYVWVLGSDDILIPGYLRELLMFLDNNDYGVIFLNSKFKKEGFVKYLIPDKFFECEGSYLSFTSANIVMSKYVSEVNLDEYVDTCLSQVLLYNKAGYSENYNAVYNKKFIDERYRNYENNGGYNYYKVFARNFLEILLVSVNNGMMSQKTYKNIKKDIFKNHIAPYTISFFFLNKKGNYSIDSAATILFRYYGSNAYAYWYLLRSLTRRIIRIIINKVKNSRKWIN